MMLINIKKTYSNKTIVSFFPFVHLATPTALQLTFTKIISRMCRQSRAISIAWIQTEMTSNILNFPLNYIYGEFFYIASIENQMDSARIR